MADIVYTLDVPAAVTTATSGSDAARARFMLQYQDKPNLLALLNAYLTQCDELEEKICELESLRYLDQATGQQLDNLGDLLGQDRLGLNDTDYRNFLRARVLINASRGTGDEIIDIFKLITDDTATINLQELFPGEIELEVSQPTIINTDLYGRMLEEAVAVGIGSTFIYLPDDPFSFSADASPPADPAPYTPTLDLDLGFGDADIAYPDTELEYNGTGGKFASV